MIINSYKDFVKNIKSRSFEGPVIICGEEKYLLTKSIDLIYSKVTMFPDLNIVKLEDTSVSFENIINSCETIPFMSDKKIIHVKNPFFLENPGSSSSKSLIKELTEYLKDMPDGIILLFTYDGKIDTTNSLYKVVKTLGEIVDYKLLRGDELQSWIAELFSKNGKKINKYELNYFISEAGNSVEQLEMEVEKLCTYIGDAESITTSDIDSIVHKSMESNIFKMVDNISRKNADKAVSILNTLLFQREDHLKILGMITRQFRLMYIIKSHLNCNFTSENIKEKLKLNEYVFKNLFNQSKSYNEKQLRNALDICLETDINLKNGKFNHESYGLALEMLIVELCK